MLTDLTLDAIAREATRIFPNIHKRDIYSKVKLVIVSNHTFLDSRMVSQETRVRVAAYLYILQPGVPTDEQRTGYGHAERR